jgi:hypothetical protein
MRLKSAFSGLAALVLGLSLSPAYASILMVDDFAMPGTPPGTNNQWSKTGLPSSKTMGTVRDLGKGGGSQVTWEVQPGKIGIDNKLTTAQNLTLQYDGTSGTAINQYMSPRPNAMAYANQWLCVVFGDFQTTSQSAITATVKYFANATGGTPLTFTQTINGGPIGGGSTPLQYGFKMPANLAYIGSINFNIQKLGTGKTTVDNIFFTDAAHPVPEPGTLALAGLGVVGLVVAARKKRS